jgi:hypothetical protein
MKTLMLAAALLVSGSALAQTTGGTGSSETGTEAAGGPDGTVGTGATGGAIVSGGSGSIGSSTGSTTATGGTSGPDPQGYPRCSRAVTDRCIQTYGRGGRRSRSRG